MTPEGRGPWAARVVAELALIVVGVLVALSVEGWWGERQDRRSELEYVSDLHAELVRNRESFATVERVQGGAVTSLGTALRQIQSGTPPDSAQALVVNLVRGGTFEIVPQFNSSVFQDLQNSGRLQLIRDDALRRAIMDHYGGLESTLVRLRGAQQQVSSGLTELIARHLPPDLVSWEQGAGPIGVQPGPAATPELFATVAMSLLADPDLEPRIQAHLVAFQLEDIRLYRFRRVFDEYSSVLESALGGVGK
jgi:hypothetical protein